MKNIKSIISYILILILMLSTVKVNADSGFDANYDSGSAGEIISSVSSAASPALELVVSKPGDENFEAAQMIALVLCSIVVYIFTCIYIYKLFDNGSKKKKVLLSMLISLLPAALCALFCLFIKLPVLLYIIITILYIITFIIITNIVIKRRINKKINSVKEIDKKFNIDNINKETFEVYKEVQYAWMDFDLNKLKKLICKELYDKYEEQLDKLKNDNQKNIMDNIEFKSNEITNIKIDNNIEIIECKMNVSCIDYIIDNEDKVIKGKKEKFNNYTYSLVFNKDLKTNKYVLIEKKMLKQK